MNPFLTTQEAAKILRVSQQSVRSYIKSGRLKSERIYRRHRIPVAALDEFLSDQRAQ